ncbi:hypothetical protein MTO96_019094 [Rhipicephalus appendiculatus]
MASTTLPTSPLRRTCSAMDPELRALINQRLALMNREDLYVIVVALVVSSRGRTCVLIYCYVSDGVLKRNGEETCLLTAASHGNAKVTVDLRAMDQLAAAGGITMVDARHWKWPQHLPGPHRFVRGVNQAVLLLNREGLYGIVLAQVVSNTRCTTVLAYHFADHSMLKWNPGETSQCIAASLWRRPSGLCPGERRLQRE